MGIYSTQRLIGDILGWAGDAEGQMAPGCDFDVQCSMSLETFTNNSA